jgi:3-oxoacyl-(acyl-carrier-protein) synthase
MLPFMKCDIDMVKMHGTGTAQNDVAEYEAIKELFGDIETIEYKSQIGHSQGCSTGVELCMLLDNYKDKNILVNASGLGNFYGSFELVI